MDDKNSVVVSAVIEVVADKIGEMLVESAGGIREYSYEAIARQALLACFSTLIDEGPTEDRLNAVSASIYHKLHDQEKTKWAGLPAIEKSFWTDIARAAITAGDVSLIGELQQT